MAPSRKQKIVSPQPVLHELTESPPALQESNIYEGVSDVWTEPQPLPDALPPVLPFDNDMLPESFSGWVTDIAYRMQCPIDFVAVAAMVSLAGVLGKKLGIRPKRFDDGWLVVGNLWGAVIGRTGVMKSPAVSEAMRPLKRLEKAKQENFPAIFQEWEKQQVLLQLHYKAFKSSSIKTVKDGKSIDLNHIPANPNDNKEPHMPRIVVNNTTVEVLGELLEQNANGLLAFCDELIGPLRAMSKQARSFYLQAWNGTDSYTFDRIVRGKNMRIDACCLSFLGGIQPSVIGDYLRDTIEADGGDGLLARFNLIVYPDVSKVWEHVDKKPDAVAMKTVFDVFDRIDTLDPHAIGQVDANDGGCISPTRCRLSFR